MRQPDNIITAIDVQPNSLSLVSLVLQGRSLHLNGAASQVLPAGVIESGNWRNPEHMYKALRQGCAALGAPVKTVVLSIATDAVITSDLMLPKSLFARYRLATATCRAGVSKSLAPDAKAPAPANAGAVGGDAGHRAHRPTEYEHLLCWDPALQPQRQL